MKTYEPDTWMLTVLILGAVIALVSTATYIGYVSLQQPAGTVTEVGLQFTQDPNYYSGIIGVAIEESSINDSTQSVNLQENTIEEENLIYSCIEDESEVYASFKPESELDLSSVTAGTTDQVNTYLGINDSEIVGAGNTYRNTTEIAFGSTNISAPVTYSNGGGSEPYTTAILNDANGELIFASKITGFQSCFNGDTCNYQYLLPVKNASNQTYYLWQDPNDDCPAGTASDQSLGNITGNVSDASGNRLTDVIIDVAGRTTRTDENGTYYLQTIEGNHKIYAIKEGYQTYSANVTIFPGNVTTQNINMVAEAEPNPFTGVGPGQDAPGTETQTGQGPGQAPPGTGQGPGQAPRVEQPREIEGERYIIRPAEIERKVRKDSFAQEPLQFFNKGEDPADVQLTMNGSVTELLQLDRKEFTVNGQSQEEVTLTIFGKGQTGVKNGTITVDGDMNATIPVSIEVISKQRLPVQALAMNVETSQKTYNPGQRVKFKTDLRNMLTDEPYPVELYFTVQEADGNETVWQGRTNVFLKTSFTLVERFELPRRVDKGEYLLRVTARYQGVTSGTSTIFEVKKPWYLVLVFGLIPVWMLLLIIAVLVAGAAGAYYIKKRIEAGKRYHLDVNYDDLPDPGPRSIYVGKIAETDRKTYFNMEKFKTHAIVAGSTGGGKSITGQVIIEEMLERDVGVVVFDPTAQWTGMLRECEDEDMIQLYDLFGLNEEDARAYPGNVTELNDEREIIDVMDYAKPGEIHVFACHKLEPEDLDIVAANAIRQIFRSQPEESKPLKMMVVFDEVHRLLPKFGGSGQGFLQVERACREFRKWGIGVMLISQVLSDFMGTIKANINTEIQMRTRSEEDLERVRQKYGEGVLRSLVKATTGTGLVESPSYNDGNPFFVSFRPILHSTQRMSDEEIEKYDEYNERIRQLRYSLDQLEEKDVDVFDLRTELGLAEDKVKTGNFNVVDVYLEGLEPRIEKEWEELGEEPDELEKERISEQELQEMFEEAKEERDDYEDESEEMEATEETHEWDDEVDPDNILELENDMLVNSMQSLYDELSAMGEDTFAAHVNEDKNDVAEWVRSAVGYDDLADRLDLTKDKDRMLELLEARKEDEDLPELTEEEEQRKEQIEAFEEMSKNPDVTQDEQEEPDSEDESKEPPEKESAGDNVDDANDVSEEDAPRRSPTEDGEDTEEESVEESEPSADESAEEQSDTGEDGESQEIDEQVEETAKEQKQDNTEDTERAPTDTNNDSTDEGTEARPREHTAPEETSSETEEEEVVTEDRFVLDNGEEIASIAELRERLHDIPEETLHAHVSEEYNHFADWIQGVFGKEELAAELRDCTTREELLEVLG